VIKCISQRGGTDKIFKWILSNKQCNVLSSGSNFTFSPAFFRFHHFSQMLKGGPFWMQLRLWD